MITVTAATGHFGRLVIDELLERGLPAGKIVAAVRNPGKAADMADRGVQVREAEMLAGAGLPQFVADAIADNNAGAARGAWHTDSQDLQQLLGRPSIPISDPIAEALQKHQQDQA